MSRKKIGNLADCVCSGGSPNSVGDVTIRVDTPRAPPVIQPATKVRKPRSKGDGAYCVMSHKGKTVHCYKDRPTAEKVASAFTSRGRAGTKFTVNER